MKEQKNIERLFQEKFKDFEAIPPQDSWDNIASRLTEKKKKKRIIPFWFQFSGIAASLVIIGSLIWNYQSENNNSIIENSNNIVSEDSNEKTNNDSFENKTITSSESNKLNVKTSDINQKEKNRIQNYSNGLNDSKNAIVSNSKEKKKSKYTDKEHPGEVLTHSVFKDTPFWIFLTGTLITGILFFQLFTTIPLYHKEQFNLSEFQTGLLLTLNGVLVFFLEMPIVSYIEKHKINKLKVITYGCMAMAISIYLLLVNNWAGILIIMMIFMTFAEMFAFPFSNSFAMSRAPKGHEGRYMAIFTMSYSLAHILSAKTGMEMIDRFSYQTNWFFMGTLGIIGVLLLIWTKKLVAKEPTRKL